MASPASSASRSLDADSGGSTHGSAKPSGEVIAITVRDDFLLELGDSLGGQVAVRPVDSLASALEPLTGSRRLQLLAIDSRDVSDLRGDVERAHTQVPHVPIIVFAASEAEKTVAGALKSSNVFAVLPIPVDRRKTAAVFEGALADAARRAAARNAGAESRAAKGDLRGALSEPRGTHADGRSDAERAGEIRYEARAPLSPEPASFAPEMVRATSEPPRGSSKLVIPVAVVAVVALAGGAYWFLSHGGSQAPPAPAARQAAAPAGAETRPVTAEAQPAASSAQPKAVEAPEVPLAQGTLDSLLEKARLAMRERRYAEPPGNSALLYYRSALRVDPTNGEARDGMTRLATLLMSRFDESLSGGRLDEAASSLASLKVAAPGDTRLGALESRLTEAEIGKALSDGNSERAATLIREAQQSNTFPAGELARWRAELAKHQDETRNKHLADLFAERIRDGHLVEPANDSAQYYLQQLREAAPGNPVAQHGARDLIAACLRKAREAAAANQMDAANQWVAQARAAGMTAGDYAAYQRDLASARQRAAAAQTDRLAELVRDRLQEGRLTEPASDCAASYLSQLKSARPGDPAVDSLGRELATRLLERATSEAHAGRASDMQSDLALARRWGADPALAQAVQDVLGGGHAGAPLQAAQPTGSPIPRGFVPKRIRYTAPEFPDRAYESHISGSVTVEFTIDVKGRPRDVRVVQSNPDGVFDLAATTAVSSWRYQPAVFNGVPTEIPTRLVIRFDAPR